MEDNWGFYTAKEMAEKIFQQIMDSMLYDWENINDKKLQVIESCEQILINLNRSDEFRQVLFEKYGWDPHCYFLDVDVDYWYRHLKKTSERFVQRPPSC